MMMTKDLMGQITKAEHRLLRATATAIWVRNALPQEQRGEETISSQRMRLLMDALDKVKTAMELTEEVR
jgi:hypothetical protein